MWMEELTNGKYKFVERYIDPYTEKEKRVSVTLNSKSNQAKNKANSILQDKINDKIKIRNNSNKTFKESSQDWFNYYKNTVKSSTVAVTHTSVKLLNKTIDDDTLIKNIDSIFIKEKTENIYYEREYSLGVTKKYKATLMSILKYEYELGNLISVPTYRMNLKLRNEKKEIKLLEPDELKAIIKNLNSTKPNLRKAKMVEILALTGLRYGELIALTYNDYDGEYIDINGTIDFRSQEYSKPVKTTPKTNAAYRRIKLPARAIELFDLILEENKFLKLSGEYDNLNYIFTNKKGLPIDYRTFQPCLRKAAVEAGIDKPVSTHYLRHTHISMLAEKNIPIKAIMDRVGHKDSSVTQEVYTHVTRKLQDKVDKQIDDIEI